MTIDDATKALIDNPFEYAKMEIALIANDHVEIKERFSRVEKDLAEFREEFRESNKFNNEWLRQVMIALDTHMDREEQALSRQATETAYQLRELSLMDHGNIHNEIKTLNEKVETITHRQQRIVKLNYTFIWASVIVGSTTVFGAVAKFLLNIW